MVIATWYSIKSSFTQLSRAQYPHYCCLFYNSGVYEWRPKVQATKLFRSASNSMVILWTPSIALWYIFNDIVERTIDMFHIMDFCFSRAIFRINVADLFSILRKYKNMTKITVLCIEFRCKISLTLFKSFMIMRKQKPKETRAQYHCLRWLFRYLKIDSEKTRFNSEDDHQFTPLVKVKAVKCRLFSSKN